MNRFDIKRKWEEFLKKREQKKAAADAQDENKDKEEDSTLEDHTEKEEESIDNEEEGISTSQSSTEKTSTDSNDTDTIDLRDVFHRLWKKKWWFVVFLPVSALLSAIVIMDVPRTFTTSTTMAPEVENPVSSGGMLSSIASSFGVDVSSTQSTDAISPTLYPDLMEDNGFVTSLFNIRVVTADNAIDTTYYAYMRYHQKQSWLSQQGDTIMKKVMKLFPKANNDFKGNTSKSTFNPYYLSKKDDGIVNKMRDDIAISVDKKTGVISITATAQDPLVCQTLADSVRERLQDFIIKYRTSKARRDVEYYEKLADDARAEYEKTRRLYAKTADANLDVILEIEKSKIEDLENTMQMQYNTYTAMNTQLEAARAKLRQYTPVFTVVKGADVPIKATGPKRMIFVAFWVFMTFFVIAFFSIKDLLFKSKQ